MHIAIFPNNPAGEYGDLAKWRDQAPNLLAHGLDQNQWIVVDLRPLRSNFGRVTKDTDPTLKESLRRWIFGYDVALFIGGMHRGTFALNPGVEY